MHDFHDNHGDWFNPPENIQKGLGFSALSKRFSEEHTIFFLLSAPAIKIGAVLLLLLLCILLHTQNYCYRDSIQKK